MADTSNKFWLRTKEFFDSRTWRIIKDILGLALFTYLLIQSIGRFPSSKGYAGACLWSLGILMDLSDLISILRHNKEN